MWADYSITKFHPLEYFTGFYKSGDSVESPIHMPLAVSKRQANPAFR